MSKELIVTPFGVAKYPSVTNPDTFGPYGNGKYKLKIIVTKEELAKFQADFIAKAGPIPKGHKVPWSEKDGECVISLASKFAPTVIDTKKQPIELGEGEYLAGGSVVRAKAEIGTYQGGKNLFLKLVQVKELVTKASGGSYADMDVEMEDDESETADALDL